MANMLIRTRGNSWKYRVATLVRVFLFFAIPSVYLLLATTAERDASDLQLNADGFTSRHLLGVVERDGRNCTSAAVLEFPPDGLTRYQRQHGYILIHCVLAIYCFVLLGTVCEQYFVPAIEIICERLNMEADVAGATFMAAASSSPELFINCVGTFVTEGDLGVGAVVGSAVFNVLAVPACCALIANRVIELDWWSVSRDCMMYAVSVVALILTLLDDKIFWHEAMLLVVMYTFYILAMVFNRQLGKFVRSGCCYVNKPKTYTEITPLLTNNDKLYPPEAIQHKNRTGLSNDLEQGAEMRRYDSTGSDDSANSLWYWPGEKKSIWKKLFWIITWPISLLLWVTIPDCQRRHRLYPVTFVMCITWIGGISYVVAWIITILASGEVLAVNSVANKFGILKCGRPAGSGNDGDTLNVPDSITGLTILAAGTSLPEAVSSVLVTNQGQGSMGISNSIGSNTFDILLCLGLPWLIKSLFYPSSPGNHWVTINSSGLSYSAICLLSTLFALYGSLALNKFQLDWKVGLTCTLVYVGFLMLAALIELNVFFVVNLPVCPH